MVVAVATSGTDRSGSASASFGASRVTSDLVVLYEFDEGSGTEVADTSGAGAPLNLDIPDPAAVTWDSGFLSLDSETLLAPATAPTKIFDEITASDEITIEAWITPASNTQSGPARIATFSDGAFQRNFTLGQDGADYDVRLRTTSTSANGTPSTSTGPQTNTFHPSHVIYTLDSGGTARIYVDGALVKQRTVSGDLSNWNSLHMFGLGNEFGADRPWLGDYHLFAIYSRALSELEIQDNFDAGHGSTLPPPPERVDTDLVSLYGFDEGGGAVVHDLLGDPMNLVIPDPNAASWGPGYLSLDSATFVKAMVPEDKLLGSVTTSNALTLEAWIKPQKTGQSGPARIVTFSDGIFDRNFTLGQSSTRYDARLRTTETSPNGIPSTATPRRRVHTSLTHLVFTRDASGETQIYVDGVPSGSRQVGGDFSTWNPDFEFGLGNEIGSSRPWLGEYHLLAVYSEALSDEQVEQNFKAGPATPKSLPIAEPEGETRTETLGPTPTEPGSGFVAAGTGLFTQPGTIDITVPANAEVRQVLLYWEGQRRSSSSADTDVTIEGIPVTGIPIGGPTVFFSSIMSQTFRADVTSLGLVSPGLNSIEIDGLSTGFADNGAGLVVVYDDGRSTHLDLRDGNDLAFHRFDPPLDTTVPQVFEFEPSSEDREATLSMFFSSVDGTAGGGERPTSIEITVTGDSGSDKSIISDAIADSDGAEWDTLNLDVAIPAGTRSVTVQAFSRDDIGRRLPASFTWTMAAFALPPGAAPDPDPTIRLQDDSYTTDEDTQLNVSPPGVLDNDTFPAVSVSSLTVKRDVANGTLSLSADGSFTYDPAENYNGPDEFEYELSFTTGEIASAVVQIEVLPVNDPPVGVMDAYETDEDTELVIAAPGVLGNDSDVDSASLTATFAPGPELGSVALNPDGSFTYTPPQGFSGADRFQYRVSDGIDDSDLVDVDITVIPVNDPPVAAPDKYEMLANGTLVVSAPGVLSNDVDPESTALTASLVSDVSNGSLTLSPDGSFTYTPTIDFFGFDQFTYEASDGLLGSGPTIVDIEVIAPLGVPVVDLLPSSDSGKFDDDDTTSDNTPTVVVEALSIDIVRLFVNGIFVGEQTGQDNPAFTLPALPNGRHIVTAELEGITGTTVESAPLAIVIDTTPPVVEITSPSDGATVESDSTTVLGTADDDLSGVDTVLCNGALATLVAMVFDCTTPLDEGPNVLTAEATDIAGNIGSDAVSVTFVPGATLLLTTSPANGEGNVSTSRETILTFSRPLDPATVNTTSIFAEFGGQQLPANRVVSSDGMRVTMFYDDLLPDGARVRVTVDGDQLRDDRGLAVDPDADGSGGGSESIDFDTTNLTPVPGTEVFGYVFDSYNTNPDGSNIPVVGATIRVDGLPGSNTLTDSNGFFTLTNIPAPVFFVHVDGSTAINAPPGTVYATVGKAFHSVAGQSIPLIMDGEVFDMFLPPIDQGDIQPLSPTDPTDIGFGAAGTQELVEMFPAIDPDAWDRTVVTFPTNSATDNQGNPATTATIIPVSADRLPAPLPPWVNHVLDIAIIAGDGATNFDVPAPACFPNLPDPDTGIAQAPGDKSALWSFDHDLGDWRVTGSATVSADGLMVCTDPGTGILAPGWHGVNPGTTADGGSIDFGDEDDFGPPEEPGTAEEPPAQPDCNPPICEDEEQEPSPPKKEVGDPVYPFSGEFHESVTDLVIPGRGLDFEWTRKYRSKIGPNTEQGNGWDYAYNISLAADINGNRVLRDGNSRGDVYELQPDGSWARDEFFRRLVLNGDGTHTLTFRDGGSWVFTPLDSSIAPGKILAISDRNGNTLTFAYDAQSRLSVVTDTFGRDVVIGYNPDGFIDSITDFIGRVVQYDYYDGAEPGGNFGDLKSVTSPAVIGTPNGNDFPNGKTVSYTYSTGFIDPRLNHNLLTVTDARRNDPSDPTFGQGPFLVNIYDQTTDPRAVNFDRVIRQIWGEPDNILDFVYQPLSPVEANSFSVMKTIVNDRNGNVEELFYDIANRLTIERQFTGRADDDGVTTQLDNRPVNQFRPTDPVFFETRHEWNEDSLRTRTIFPEGNVMEYDYASDIDPDAPPRAQSNVLAEVRLPDADRGGDQSQLITTFEYEPLYNQLRSSTEPRGNDPGFVPQSGGPNLPSRYTTTYTFDYEEACDFAAIGAHLDLDPLVAQQLLADANICLAPLGDVNGDGITNQISGNVIRVTSPAVNLLPDSRQALVEGGTLQPIVKLTTYNEFGQVLSVTDPEGNVHLYEYYPANDPDGDGLDLIPGAGTGPFGYVAQITQDAVSSPERNSGTNPTPTNIRIQFGYDPVGNTTRLVDGRGVATDYVVNELNQTVQVISAAAHNLFAVDPPNPALTDFQYLTNIAYDANDNVIIQDVQNIDTNGPNLDGFVTTQFEYNILDRLISQSVEVSTGEILVTTFEYDENENQTRIVEPEGNVIEMVYDERDLLFTRTRGFGTPEASTLTYGYDQNRNVVSIVDAADNNGDGLNEESLNIYDGFDRVVEAIDAVGNVRELSYDPASNVVRERRLGQNGGPSPLNSSGAGNVLLSEQEFLYDEMNRTFQVDEVLFSNTAPVGPEGALTPGDGKVTTRYEYDRNSRQTRLLDDNDHESVSLYDGADRVIREVDELNNETTFQYDDNHNPIVVTVIDRSPGGLVPDEVFTTVSEFDALNRATTVTDNLGNLTTYAYDSRDNLISTVDQLGNTMTYVHDGINRLLEQRYDLRVGGTGAGAIDVGNPANADGGISKLLDWDGNSRLVAQTDDNGNTTATQYDALNRLVLETYADLTTKTYVYDADDNVVTFTDQNGSVHTNRYDGINRLIQTDVSRAAGVEGTTLWTFEYDGLSRQTLATDNNDPGAATDDSVVEFRYDSLSRVVTEVQNGRTVASEFDGIGNRLQLTYPDGRVIENTYDGLDRLATVADQGSLSNIAEYDYVGTWRVLERRYDNGTILTYHDGAGTDTGYDGLRRTVELRHESSVGDLLTGFSYAYDRQDNRRFELDLLIGTADVYEYDSVYRLTRAGIDVNGASLPGITNNDSTNADVAGLTGASDNTYRLDGVGNWAERTDAGGTTIFTPNNQNEYDAIGGVAQVHDENGNLTADGTLKYFYDFANRLVRVTDSADAEIARYAYDASGRRIRKDVGGDITTFFYASVRAIEERDGSDATVRQYVFGAGIDEVIELTTGGQTYFYHDNSIGSVTALTDDSGTVVERYSYDPYGRATVLAPDGTTVLPQSAVGNPFTFTGRRLDEESGLFYYRARYYDAERGRFIQRDPLGYVDGMGLYAYVGNNPVNFFDPLGTEKQKEKEKREKEEKKKKRLEELRERYEKKEPEKPKEVDITTLPLLMKTKWGHLPVEAQAELVGVMESMEAADELNSSMQCTAKTQDLYSAVKYGPGGLDHFEVTKWRWGGWFGDLPSWDPGGHSAVVIYPKGGDPERDGIVLDNWWGTEAFHSGVYAKNEAPGGWAYEGTHSEAFDHIVEGLFGFGD